MKRITPMLTALLLTLQSATAQVSPNNYSLQHKDSSWYVTLHYDIEKLPSNAGMIIVTHLCNADTCISTAAQYFQGKKYNKRYVKRHGHTPHIHKAGNNQCTIVLPEEYASDTIWGITYSEYSDKNGTTFALDTMSIALPPAPSFSCHRAAAASTIADHIAREHPYVKSISHYTPLQDKATNAPTRQIVRYRTNSALLNTNYMRNAKTIEEIMAVINSIMADSTTTVEAVQIVGYNSPDAYEAGSRQLGYQRAIALRDHIRKQHHLPQKVFEVADGGSNWSQIYNDIAALSLPHGDSLITMLKHEPSPTKRELLLRKYDNGHIYNELARASFAKHRAAAVNAIYYHNKPDSAAIAVNNAINELLTNPTPDYHKIAHTLRKDRNDPRVLNLQGVIDYRRHHRHAAEKAFTKAAAMGDEQAAVNLIIISNNK